MSAKVLSAEWKNRELDLARGMVWEPFRDEIWERREGADIFKEKHSNSFCPIRKVKCLSDVGGLAISAFVVVYIQG